MILSVLIPTRGRPDLAVRAAQSVLDHATVGEVEILFRVDSDDLSGLDKLLAVQDAKVIVGPRYGYAGLNRYYDELAGLAKAPWLFLFNDDCVLRGDARLGKALGTMTVHLGIIRIEDGFDGDEKQVLFPIVPRVLYQILGTLGWHYALDSYLHALFYQCMRRRPLSIPGLEIVHERATTEEAEKLSAEHRMIWSEPEVQCAVTFDAKILLLWEGRA